MFSLKSWKTQCVRHQRWLLHRTRSTHWCRKLLMRLGQWSYHTVALCKCFIINISTHSLCLSVCVCLSVWSWVSTVSLVCLPVCPSVGVTVTVIEKVQGVGSWTKNDLILWMIWKLVWKLLLFQSLCKLCLYYSWLDFNCCNITKHSVIASNALYVLMISSKECEQTWGGLSVFWYSYYL